MRGCKKPNPTGGRGGGGRKTFIDEIISKAETSQRTSSRRPQIQYSSQTDRQTEEVLGPKRKLEAPEHKRNRLKSLKRQKILRIEQAIQDKD